MRLWKKVVLGIVGTLVTLVVVVEVKAAKRYGGTPYPDVKSSSDPAVIERGAYVVNALGHCALCHMGSFDEAVALKVGERPTMKGGLDFSSDAPFGSIRSANITPDTETGIGAWTDREIARVIRTGVKRDGTLSPFMALAVGDLADDDLAAVVSYLRSVPPVKNRIDPPSYNFLGKALLAFLFRPDPAQARWKAAPPPGPTLERGEYLVKGSVMCEGCHTKRDPMKGFAYVGEPLTGGECRPAKYNPGFEMCTPNLTPAPKTGHITEWSEDRFLARFRGGPSVKAGMPWQSFGNMTDDDVRAIYRYLRTVKPVENETGPIFRQVGWKPGDPIQAPEAQ